MKNGQHVRVKSGRWEGRIGTVWGDPIEDDALGTFYCVGLDNGVRGGTCRVGCFSTDELQPVRIVSRIDDEVIVVEDEVRP